MTKNRYSREFENQALVKVRERADKSVGTIAQELGMSEGTLRKWVTNANRKIEPRRSHPHTRRELVDRDRLNLAHHRLVHFKLG